jgi:hypothetical protein
VLLPRARRPRIVRSGSALVFESCGAAAYSTSPKGGPGIGVAARNITAPALPSTAGSSPAAMPAAATPHCMRGISIAVLISGCSTIRFAVVGSSMTISELEPCRAIGPTAESTNSVRVRPRLSRK